MPLTDEAIRRIAARYRQGDIDRALFDRPRPGATELLSASEKQRIIAMVCSDPPAGRTRWTVRLVTEEVVRRELVPHVGRETIRVLLQSHDLKPWREKMGCIADLTPEYLARMEDVLALYERPYDPKEPVVCFDEKLVACMRRCARHGPPAPGTGRSATTNTAGVEPPTFSGSSNRKRAAT